MSAVAVDETPYHVVTDAAGEILAEVLTPERTRLAEDGSAVVTAVSTKKGDVKFAEQVLGEVLSLGFAGTAVKSCVLAPKECRLDLYPGLDLPLARFRALTHGEIVAAYVGGPLARLRRGERVWATSRSFTAGQAEIAHVSHVRGEILVGEAVRGRVVVVSLADGAELFAWEVALDPSFLTKFLGKDDSQELLRQCAKPREESARLGGSPEPFTPQGYPSDWRWRVAAAGFDGTSAAILPNGDLLLVGGAPCTVRGELECPERGWVWVVSRAHGTVANAATITSLFPEVAELKWNSTGWLESDDRGNVFVFLDLPGADTVFYRFPPDFFEFPKSAR